MVTVTKRFRWAMGHRLLRYAGRCANLHGHDYVADVTIAADSLDDLGMVIDFGRLKGTIGQWLDQNLDHKVLVSSEDAETVAFLEETSQAHEEVKFNPTAENMVVWLADQFKYVLETNYPKNPRNVRLAKIVLFETPDSWCTWQEG